MTFKLDKSLNEQKFNITSIMYIYTVVSGGT